MRLRGAWAAHGETRSAWTTFGAIDGHVCLWTEGEAQVIKQCVTPSAAPLGRR